MAAAWYHIPMKRHVRKLLENFSVVVGVLLVWRGLWYLFDGIDRLAFGGDHTISTIGGIIVGVLILYLPDRDLKELGKI